MILRPVTWTRSSLPLVIYSSSINCHRTNSLKKNTANLLEIKSCLWESHRETLSWQSQVLLTASLQRPQVFPYSGGFQRWVFLIFRTPDTSMPSPLSGLKLFDGKLTLLGYLAHTPLDCSGDFQISTHHRLETPFIIAETLCSMSGHHLPRTPL